MGQKRKSLGPRIVVLGIGGCGGNTLDHLMQAGVSGADLIALNTDAQDLEKIRAHKKIVLGPNVSGGLGAGANPDLGARAMEESLDELMRELEGAHMVFLTAGFGGGTGSGALPVAAQAIAERGILSVAVVTLPFSNEGRRKWEVASEALEKMKPHVDTYITIHNDRLLELAGKKPFTQALREGSMVLYRSVKGILDIISHSGIINVDFRDVDTVLRKGGQAMMGIGTAEGEDRVEKALERALRSPILEHQSIQGARHVLLNVVFGSEDREPLSDEWNYILGRVRSEASINGEEPEIIHGLTRIPELGEKLEITIIASGIAQRPRRGISPLVRKRPRPKPEAPRGPSDNPDLPAYYRRKYN